MVAYARRAKVIEMDRCMRQWIAQRQFVRGESSKRAAQRMPTAIDMQRATREVAATICIDKCVDFSDDCITHRVPSEQEARMNVTHNACGGIGSPRGTRELKISTRVCGRCSTAEGNDHRTLAFTSFNSSSDVAVRVGCFDHVIEHARP